MHTVTWFQEFISNTNNSQTDLSDPRDSILTDHTISGQSGPGSDGNEYTPLLQSSITKVYQMQ